MRDGTEQPIGRVLQQTYRIEGILGRGGMGVVYEASHLRLHRRFAIKLLSQTFAEDTEALERFQREALVTSALGHPHILEVIDFNHTDEGSPYIVMELLEGEDLATRIRRFGRLDLASAASIVQQTTSALQAAHEKNVVHRDLKPQNIFLCRGKGPSDDYVKVVDFGISKVIGAQTLVTRDRSLIGTPWFMSPEQAEGELEIDARSDVYSMAVIVYHVLSGNLPFKADSIPSLLYKIVNTPPPPLAESLPDLCPEVEAVITRAMSKRPAERQPSMQLFWQAFAAALQVAGITPPGADSQPRSSSDLDTLPPPGARLDSAPLSDPEMTLPPDSSTAPLSRRRWIWGALGGGLFVALCVWLLVYQGETPSTTRPAVPVARVDLALAAPDAAAIARPDLAARAVAARPDAGPALAPDLAARSRRVRRPGPRRPLLAAGRRPPAKTGSAEARPVQPATRPVQPTTRPAQPATRPAQPARMSLTTPWQGESVPAEIFFDGKRVGESPMYRELPAGVYRISARKNGFQQVTTTVRLKAGKRARVVLPLRR